MLLSTLAVIPALAVSTPPSHQGISLDRYEPANYTELSIWSKIAAYRMASYLTDPVCRAREYSVRLQMTEELSPSPIVQDLAARICLYVQSLQLGHEEDLDPEIIARFAEKCFLIAGCAGCAMISPFTSIPGMILRSLASNLETERFIHYLGSAPEKQLQNSTLSFLLWNICGIKGGYEIEEGGQMPMRDDLSFASQSRLANIVKKLLEEDADILSLNEVFDINDAVYLVSALQTRYAHFIIQCGSRTVGPNSGLFLASKFSIKGISFTPFPKEFLVGSAKYAEKGFLTVTVQDAKGPIFTTIHTHLQHSDQPSYPTQEEKLARKQALSMIFDRMFLDDLENVVLAGDLNLDDEELASSHPESYAKLQKTTSYDLPEDEETTTWLGDQWYVEHGNQENTFSFFSAGDRQRQRKISKGLNLDHIAMKIHQNTSGPSIQSTHLKKTGYKPHEISRASLSDHMILISSIHVPRP